MSLKDSRNCAMKEYCLDLLKHYKKQQVYNLKFSRNLKNMEYDIISDAHTFFYNRYVTLHYLFKK